MGSWDAPPLLPWAWMRAHAWRRCLSTEGSFNMSKKQVSRLVEGKVIFSLANCLGLPMAEQMLKPRVGPLPLFVSSSLLCELLTGWGTQLKAALQGRWHQALVPFPARLLCSSSHTIGKSTLQRYTSLSINGRSPPSRKEIMKGYQN